jgi:hypothetical protein
VLSCLELGPAGRQSQGGHGYRTGLVPALDAAYAAYRGQASEQGAPTWLKVACQPGLHVAKTENLSNAVAGSE